MATNLLPFHPYRQLGLSDAEMDSFVALLHLVDPSGGIIESALGDNEGPQVQLGAVMGLLPGLFAGRRSQTLPSFGARMPSIPSVPKVAQYPPPLPEVLSESFDDTQSSDNSIDSGSVDSGSVGITSRPLKTRRKKDRAAPKKPRSAYIVFLDRHRETLRKQRPDLKMIEVTAELAKTWRTASPQEKATCEALAKCEIDHYRLKKDMYLRQKQPTAASTEVEALSDSLKPKAKRRKKDKCAPRKGRSAFILFLMDFRSAHKQADNSNEAFSCLSKQVSSAWNSLTDEQRSPYLERAASEAEEYRLAKMKYLAQKAEPDALAAPGNSHPLAF